MTNIENPSATGPAFGSVSLHVSNLNVNTTEQAILEVFGRVGRIASIRLCRDRVTNISRCYAYVNYDSTEAAQRAKTELNYVVIDGNQCRVTWAQRDPTVRSGASNVFIKNVPKTVDNPTFEKFFARFGEVTSAYLATDKATGAPLGYGYVNFASPDVAKSLLEQTSVEFDDAKLEVNIFKSQKDRATANASFTNIYIKNFPAEWTSEDLVKHFSQFGTVTSHYIAKSTSTGSEGLPYAFVNFATHDQASAATEGSNVEVNGKKLYVSRALSKSERQRQNAEAAQQRRVERMQKWASCNLFIKHLPQSITDEAVRELFSKFGVIISMRVLRHADGIPTGVAYVCFNSSEEAAKAIAECNQSTHFGTPIFVTLHQTKAERTQQQQQRQHMAMGAWQAGFRMNGYAPQPGQMMVPRGMSMVPAGPYGKNMYMMPVGGFPNQRMPRRPQGAAAGANGARPRNAGNRRAPRGGVAPQSLEAEIAKMTPEEARNHLGSLLYDRISKIDLERAPKITGMILEMSQQEIIGMLNSKELFDSRMKEADEVLRGVAIA